MKIAYDLTKRGTMDRKNINVDKPSDVDWWCQKLRCTEEELRNAIQTAGTSSTTVNEYLKVNR